MEEKVVRTITIIITTAIVFTISLLLAVPGLHAAAERFGSPDILSARTGNDDSVMAYLKSRELEKMSQENDEDAKHQLRMEIPNDIIVDDITFEDDYLDRRIVMSVPGLPEDYFREYSMVGSSESIKDIKYTVKDGVGAIEFLTDQIMVCQYTESGRYLYLDFTPPCEYFDHVVVIDAGHGGRMPGASSNDGRAVEKDINLDIVKQLKDVFDEAGDETIGVYYTRLTDVNPDFKDRVGLANELNADVFLSVHINASAKPEESYITGTGVMYHQGDETGRSKIFARKCLKSLLKELGTNSKRTIPGDDIYIIRNSKVPVALAEIGFITNEEECANLVDPSYQRRTAEALHRAIIKTMKKFDKLEKEQ